MQKKIIALAIAAAFAAPVAMAQTVVYGSVDGGLRHQTNDKATEGTTDSMRMGQYNSTRWGIKSVEDMGDGMKANVNLEGSLTPTGVGSNADMNSGASVVAVTTNSPANNPFGLLFDRTATVGVASGATQFDMGWQQTVSFKTIGSYDPLNYKLLGVSGMSDAKGNTKAMAIRSGGMQVSSKFGDVTVAAGYDMNDSAPTRQPSVGTGRALGATYASGAINAGAAYSTQEASAGVDNAATHVTAGAGYKFGEAKLSVGYAKKATKTTAADRTVTDMWLGASYNVSPLIGVTAAYYSTATNAGGAGTVYDSTRKAMVVAATYALSKKTQLYAEMDRVVSGTAAASSVETIAIGTAAGISTTF